MGAITEKLDILLETYEKKGFSLSDNLRPGLSDSELDQWSKERAISLPPDLRQLFGWRNGCINRYAGTANCLVFRDNIFVGLSDYEEILAGCEPFVSAYELYEPFPFPIAKSIPIAEFEGNTYVVPTTQVLSGISNPVVVVGEDLSVHFLSISSMLDTALAWVNEPDYTLEEPWTDNEEVSWEQFNPGVFDLEF
jgi:hypothetical protein